MAMSEAQARELQARFGATSTCECTADAAARTAAAYYAKGYFCGESVLRAVNEVSGSPLPPEVSRLASGFCEGLGGSKCICGALAGGTMALGLISGRQSEDERWEPSYYATAELRARWIADQEAETCDEVVARVADGDMDAPERWSHCCDLVGRTARWVLEIAEEHSLGEQVGTA